MGPTEAPDKPEALRIVAAFSVHVLTVCGAACALLALVAAVRAEWTRMFVWLGLALVIDGVDGTFARRLRVAELLPRWSGELLDFVVDFPTYVFVPAYAIAAGGLLPPTATLPLGLIVTVSGALYFADRRMKTPDSYFRGFPALWNVAAFYLFLLKPLPWLGAAAIAVLAAVARAQSGGAGAVGRLGTVCARAESRSARMGWRGARGDRRLFRDRRPAARLGHDQGGSLLVRFKGRRGACVIRFTRSRFMPRWSVRSAWPVVPCAALATTYDRAPPKVGMNNRRRRWLRRCVCIKSAGLKF